MSLKTISVLLTMCLLGGAAVDKLLFRLSYVDGTQYHQAIREAAAWVPTRVGEWVGTDCPIPQAAVTLLHPNVILSRRYEHMQSGRSVSLLLVQCSDARDLLGHYPPVCYSGQGWMQGSAAERSWPVGDWMITGMQYEFASTRAERLANIVVCNFMVLPDGSTCRDMKGVDAAAKDVRRRALGAAQVQMICDSSIPPAERDEIFELMIRAARPLLDRIRSGVEK